jgi:hypothetical protein
LEMPRTTSPSKRHIESMWLKTRRFQSVTPRQVVVGV